MNTIIAMAGGGGEFIVLMIYNKSIKVNSQIKLEKTQNKQKRAQGTSWQKYKIEVSFGQVGCGHLNRAEVRGS